MVSKSYVPNQSLCKDNYGQGMARFNGFRMQYGKGLGSIFKRVSFTLLSEVAKIAPPNVLKTAKGIVKELVGQFLDCCAMASMPGSRKRVIRGKINKEYHFNEKAPTRYIRHILIF